MNSTAHAPLAFRTACRADTPAIVRLVERAYRGDASRAGWTTEAHLLDGQRTDAAAVSCLVTEPASRILLAERAGELVGSVHLALAAGPSVYVGMLAVEPTLQGAGVGRALLGEAERLAARERPGAGLRMTVIAQRAELIAWYERRGYARTGERAPFPYGEPRFGLPRRDDLYFVVLEKPAAR